MVKETELKIVCRWDHGPCATPLRCIRYDTDEKGIERVDICNHLRLKPKNEK